MKNIRNIIEQKYPPENPNDLWLKDDALYKSTHKGWTPLTAGGDSSTNGVISTTWLELKDKRDVGKLTPGALYRITDYNCTTTQENTQSAGHQFDIVLLALSNNKLAEEGWAMMHDNIYDVTFSDGVTKKCYLCYEETSELYNLVDIETLLGVQMDLDGAIEGGVINIDHQNKTILISPEAEATSDILAEENLTYNYFQNSNLSAWKVWYCLDNDTDRFAWASDAEYADYGGDHYNYNSALNKVINDITYYGFQLVDDSQVIVYSTERYPMPTDNLYIYKDNEMVLDDTWGQDYNFFGTGVIYRLIDEWNNDVGYDFKNIQFVRPMTDGNYDPDNGEDTWVYTFNGWDGDNSACVDATTDITLGFKDTDNNIHFIKSLGDNVFLEECCDIKIMDTESGLITLSSCLSTTLIATYIFELAGENGAIYIGNKKVLTEE